MDNKISNIYGDRIELTKEQQACVNYKGDKTLLVKGLAGSGKSIAIMQIARKFLDQKNKDTLVFFSHANTFCQTIKEFFEHNGNDDDRVTVTTLASHITHVYNIIGGPKYKTYTGKLYDQKRLEIIKEALEEHRAKNGEHRFHNLDLEFWLDEFTWMKGMNVSSEDIDYYLSIPRKGRGSNVRMTYLGRRVAFQIYVIYEQKRKAKMIGDWDDMTLYVIRNANRIPDDQKFEFVLIDEAQDLSLAQMLAAKCFTKKNMVVAMDMNQRIYDKQWTPKQLGIETTTKKLTKSMRTTVQIDALAESIRSKNDEFLSEDDKSLRAKPEREGALPRLVHIDEISQEKKYVTEQIKAYLAKNNNITIGVISSKNSQIKTYAAWMTDAGIPHEIITPKTTFSMSVPGVKIINVYNAKGLEFDRVIIPQFFEGYFPYKSKSKTEEELNEFLIKCRNIAYVAMTRAKHTLLITYAGEKGSRFIADMDPAFYEAIGDPKPFNTSFVGDRNGKPTNEVEPPPMAKPKDVSSESKTLVSFFEGNGLEVIDKRPAGGALWVVGDKSSIQQYVKEAYTVFGAWGHFSEKGGRATNHRPAWFTSCKK